MSLLQLDIISYTYPGDTGAIHNISMSIERGANVVLMGANGSGRSTLFLTLAGVLKAQSGSYLLNNRKVLFKKKQVALAGVLAMEPEIILLDEPFAWLDYRQSQRLKKLLNDLHLQGKTLVVSTHDSNLALEWGQQALVMQKGHLVADKSVQTLMADHSLLDQLDLEPPVALMNAD